jgi:hypothetical protein
MFPIACRPKGSFPHSASKLEMLQACIGGKHIALLYDFTEGAGQTLTDRSGHAQNGTMIGGTWGVGTCYFDVVDDVLSVPYDPGQLDKCTVIVQGNRYNIHASQQLWLIDGFSSCWRLGNADTWESQLMCLWWGEVNNGAFSSFTVDDAPHFYALTVNQVTKAYALVKDDVYNSGVYATMAKFVSANQTFAKVLNGNISFIAIIEDELSQAELAACYALLGTS